MNMKTDFIITCCLFLFFISCTDKKEIEKIVESEDEKIYKNWGRDTIGDISIALPTGWNVFNVQQHNNKGLAMRTKDSSGHIYIQRLEYSGGIDLAVENLKEEFVRNKINIIHLSSYDVDFNKSNREMKLLLFKYRKSKKLHYSTTLLIVDKGFTYELAHVSSKEKPIKKPTINETFLNVILSLAFDGDPLFSATEKLVFRNSPMVDSTINTSHTLK